MSAGKFNDEQHDHDGEPSDAEKLADMTLERDFFAHRMEDALAKLEPIILGMSHDLPRREELLKIYFSMDEAKYNAFWLRSFAGKTEE